MPQSRENNMRQFMEPPRYSVIATHDSFDIGSAEVESHRRCALNFFNRCEYEMAIVHCQEALSYARRRADLKQQVEALEALHARAQLRLDTITLEATGVKSPYPITDRQKRQVERIESERQDRIKAQRDEWEREDKEERRVGESFIYPELKEIWDDFVGRLVAKLMRRKRVCI